MIYLHKILPALFLPVGITLLLIVAGLVSRRRWPLWLAFAVLMLSANPVVSKMFARLAEGGAIRAGAVAAPTADAIVVLSGGRTVAPGPAAISEWGDADRFFGGVELFKAGKAPLLVFTGGWMPWAPDAPLEGAVLSQYAREFGVPIQNIKTTGAATNTAAEASAVAELLRRDSTAAPPAGRPHILLVTSAYHIPRSRLLFERAGLTVTPFPVDYQRSVAEKFSLLDLVPTADALDRTETAWREVYARLFYRIVK